MLKALAGLFSGGPYYLRLNRDRIALRDLDSNRTIELQSALAIDASNEIASIGQPISPSAVQVVNPFDHPRVLVHDFVVAEKLCAYAFRQVANISLFRPAPVVVVHPDLELDGGLTGMEARLLHEMAEGAGARRVFVHYGPVLADDQVRQIADGAVETGY